MVEAIDRQEVFRICRDFYDEFNNTQPNNGEIIILSKELIMLSDLSNNTFTRGERQLLRSIGNTLCAEYTMTSLTHPTIDYAAMRVHVELLEKAIIDGLEDRNILLIEIDVLFNDVLKNYKVRYVDNSNSGDSLAGIYVEWNAVSELYNSYVAYSVSYQGFDKQGMIFV